MKTLLDEVERNRHVIISNRFAFLQKRPGQSQLLIMRQPQGVLRDLGQLRALEIWPSSFRVLAEATRLSKSAVQTALELLRRRELIEKLNDHATAVGQHGVLRHWR